MSDTLEQLANELGLRSTPTDLDALREELRGLLANLHPDRTGGSFASDEAKEQFLRVKSALESLGSHAGATFVPVTQLPVLVREVTAALQVQGVLRSEESKAHLVTDYQKNKRRKYFLPRLTSAALASICGVLFTFPSSIVSHPFVLILLEGSGMRLKPIGPGEYALTPEQLQFLTLLFGVAFFVSAAYFLLTWWREQRENVAAEYLVSEQGLRDAFSHLCAIQFPKKEPSASFVFSTKDFVDSVQRDSSPVRGILDTRLAEAASLVLLERLTQRGAVRRVSRPDVDEWYEVDQNIVERYYTARHKGRETSRPAQLFVRFTQYMTRGSVWLLIGLTLLWAALEISWQWSRLRKTSTQPFVER